MINIAIADDDEVLIKLFRDNFKTETYFNCVFVTYSIESLISEMAYANDVEYLFLDIDFAGISSIEYISEIKQKFPRMEIIMFSNNSDEESIVKALYAGASGFLPKSVPVTEIKDYIMMILKGGAAITPGIAKTIIHYLQPKGEKIQDVNGKAKKLSSKDMQILKLVASGYSYQHIADTVGLSLNGVRYHIKKIYKFLNVKNRAEAGTALKNGLVRVEN